MTRRRLGRCSILLLALPVMAACGGDDGATPTVGPTATVAATETPLPGATVEEIVWTTAVDPVSNEPVRPVDRFSADTASIYGVVRVAYVPEGATLSSAWSYNGVPLAGAGSSIVPSQTYLGGYVEFHLTRDDQQDWPDGEYELTISLNGQAVQTKAVQVSGP